MDKNAELEAAKAELINTVGNSLFVIFNRISPQHGRLSRMMWARLNNQTANLNVSENQNTKGQKKQ